METVDELKQQVNELKEKIENIYSCMRKFILNQEPDFKYGERVKLREFSDEKSEVLETEWIITDHRQPNSNSLYRTKDIHRVDFIGDSYYVTYCVTLPGDIDIEQIVPKEKIVRIIKK